MVKEEYTISDLERLTGFSRRTIHFYSKEKLIPHPSGTGGAARYNEVHVLRLKLIKRLQSSHLKLSGIKEVFDASSIDEMRKLLSASDLENEKWNAEAVDNWINQNLSQEYHIEEELHNTSIQSNSNKRNISYLGLLKRETIPAGVTWQRIQLMDGVEVNIRSDVPVRYASFIFKWIEVLKRSLKRSFRI